VKDVNIEVVRPPVAISGPAASAGDRTFALVSHVSPSR
jgi:hypothetical protein